MSVVSGQSIVVGFTTRVFSTGAQSNADSLPTGTLYLNGTANGATVTVTNVATGKYKAAVTLPTLAIADIVEIEITAVVSSVTDNAVIWRDTKDTALDGSGNVTFANTSIATVTTLTNAPSDSSGVTTLLSRVGGSITISGGKVAATMGSSDYSGNTVQTGDAYGRLGVAGVGLTNLGDTRIANLDATVSSRTKPADTQAAVTLVATTTNLTNAPTAGDLTATMKTSVTTAATAATPTAAAVTGAVGSVTGAVGSVTGSVGSVVGLTASNLDATVSSRMVTYTQPTGFLAATFPSTVSSYAGADTSGTTTLLTRIAAAVALAGSAPSWYTAPVDVSAHVDAIYAKLPAGTIADESLVIAATDALMTRIGMLSTHGDSAWATATGFVLAASAPIWYAAPVDVSASVTAIKAKTDSLTFTIAGNLDANVQYVNDVQIKGTGTSGDPWNPV